MVIWANRSVLHKANGDYDMTRRHLYRIMVQGRAGAGHPLPHDSPIRHAQDHYMKFAISSFRRSMDPAVTAG